MFLECYFRAGLPSSDNREPGVAMVAENAAKRRVVLTGFGVVSSIGIGAEEFTDSLRAGRSGARPISVFDVEGFQHSNGCEVTAFEPEEWITNTPVSELGRATRFAVGAAAMAVADAGFTPGELA